MSKARHQKNKMNTKSLVTNSSIVCVGTALQLTFICLKIIIKRKEFKMCSTHRKIPIPVFFFIHCGSGKNINFPRAKVNSDPIMEKSELDFRKY